MLRSHWMGPAVLVLASAGLARAQESSVDVGSAGKKDRFLTVQEIGRPPQQCKLLKSWHETDGSKAYQVQSVTTGEMISIFDARSTGADPSVGMSGKGQASRIVHWGMADHPPSGTPEAPATATIHGTPLRNGLAMEMFAQPKMPENARPYVAKPPPGGWPEAYARESAPKKVREVPRTAVQTVPLPVPALAPPVVRTEEKKDMKPATSAPAKAPVAAVPAQSVTPAPAVVQAPTVSKWAPVPTPSPVSPYAPITVAKLPASPPAAAVIPLPQVNDFAVKKPAEVTKPAASDWQQSWGKVEKPKSSLLASAAPPPAPALRKEDPLQDPENYMKVTTEERITRKFKEKSIKDAERSVTDATPKPAVVIKPLEPPKPEKVVRTNAVQAVAAPVVASKPTGASPPAPTLNPWLAPPVPAATTAVPTVVNSPVPPVVTTTTALPVPSFATSPPAMPTTSSTQAARQADMIPPPPMPLLPARPQFISAAAIAANDDSGNAFSSPRPAAKTNPGSARDVPPAVSMMPGYSPVPGAGYPYTQIPVPPPVIATAPSAGAVAASYPLSAQSAVAAPAPTDAMGSVASLSPRELLMTLHNSLYPSQREWAADRLTFADWRNEPQVIDGLVTAARSDPAPLVRVGCLRTLARMRATCEPALAIARDLRNDADTRVRQEAEQTLAALQVVQPARLRD